MSQERSTTARSFRAVSLAITLVTLVAFSTIAYSAYADYNAAVSAVGDGSPGKGISVKTVASGTTATLYVNATIPNKGLYPVRVEMSCDPAPGSTVSCVPSSVTVLPGTEGTLQFKMVVGNPADIPGARGNLSLSLVPFASLNIGIDLGSLVGQQA